MKLIRLVTDDNKAFFETKFNEEIVINPNSKIALSNASFENLLNEIIIDSDNDEIKFQIITGNNERSVSLSHNTYTGSISDTNNLLKNIQRKMNEALQFVDGEVGVSFRVTDNNINHPTKGKIAFHARRMDYQFHEIDYEFFGNASFSGALGEDRRALFQDEGNAFSDDSNKFLSIEHFSLGCAVARCKIRSLVDNSSADNGFRMWLTTKKVDELEDLDTIPIADTKIYLQVAPVDGGANSGTFRYKTSKNGAALVDSNKNVLSHAIEPGGDPSTEDDHADVDNDIVEIAQYGGKLRIIVYRDGEAAAEELANFDYDQVEDGRLYFGMSFQGDIANTSIESLKVSIDPFSAPVTNKLKATIQKDLMVGTGLPPAPPEPEVYDLEFRVNLPNRELREFLGFTEEEKSVRFDYSATILGDNLFLASVFNDSYIFELLNIDLESYDSLSNGKRNILKVIPAASSSNSNVVNYEASNQDFINIRNKFPLSLRNIKARILANDLTNIDVRGFSVVTLLLKDENE
jgi:hypothetical protein